MATSTGSHFSSESKKKIAQVIEPEIRVGSAAQDLLQHLVGFAFSLEIITPPYHRQSDLIASGAALGAEEKACVIA